MPTVFLVRPGRTDFDEQDRIQGALDLPLNQAGEADVARLIEQLSRTSIDVIYTSPNDPARSTAEALADNLGLKVKKCEDLRNLNCGLWQGLQVQELRQKQPRVFKQWRECPETVSPPGGEPVAEAIERVERAVRKLLKKHRSFAIVASEPVATLVSCAVRKTKPAFPEMSRAKSSAPPVEVIEVGENGEATDRSESRVQYKVR